MLKIKGYVSTFKNIDKHNDIVMPGACNKFVLDDIAVPVLWAHEASNPIGFSTSWLITNIGLYFEGFIFDAYKADTVKTLVENKVFVGLSIGYKVIKSSKENIVKENPRKLEVLHIEEISVTLFPANAKCKLQIIQ